MGRVSLRTAATLLLTCMFAVCTVCAQSNNDDPMYRVHIRHAPNAGKELANRLSIKGISGVPRDDQNVVEVVASARDLVILKLMRLPHNIVDNAMSFNQKLASDGLLAGFHTLDAINEILFSTATLFPNISKVVDIGSEYGVGNTHENRPIYALKISDNVSIDEDEPNVLVVSLLNAREIANPEIVLDIIRKLTEDYLSDDTIRSVVDSNEIFLAPVWNPDGLEYVWNKNNLWKKNRSPVSTTAYGVDLSRNFELGWQGSCSGSIMPSSETFRGPSPNSERESQNLILFSRKRNFAKVLDLQSFGREVHASYKCESIPTPIDEYIVTESEKLANKIGYKSDTPRSDGQFHEFAIKELTNYAFTVQTGTDLQTSYEAALAEAGTVWPLVMDVFSKNVPLTGRITDGVTGGPVEAEVSVRNIIWQREEARRSDSRHGRYNLFLPDGSYIIDFTAKGYQVVTETISVDNSAQTVKDITLLPL